MKTVIGILLVLVMALAVVPICAAGTGPAGKCFSTPAYTHYVGVHEVPCPVDVKIPVTPNPMGTW